MTDAQIRLYRREWGAARKALRARGMAPTVADAERHAIHVRVLGSDKSSLELSNRELDLVLGAFRAISRPADLEPQLDEAGQPVKRMRFVISSLCAELERPAEYAEAVAQMMYRERGIASGELDELGTDDLRKVIVALRKQVKRENQVGKKEAKAKRSTSNAERPTSNGGNRVPEAVEVEGDPF